jgi:hypothetical protein
MPTSTARSVRSSSQSKLGEGATLRVAPELADPVGSLEVRQHEDVEQLSAGSGTERVEALPKSALELVRVSRPRDYPSPSGDRSNCKPALAAP